MLLKRRKAKSFRLRGFTLIEALVSVSILGIIATMAIPNFISLMEKKRAEDVASLLAEGFRLAASEAKVRNTDVKIVPYTAGDAQWHWSSGWKICEPAVAATNCVNGTLIKVQTFDDAFVLLEQSDDEGVNLSAYDFTELGVSHNNYRGNTYKAYVYNAQNAANARANAFAVVNINNMGLTKTNVGN